MRFWLALAFAILVMSSRFCVIAKFGVQEPYMDSFSEIQDYKAANEGQLGEVFGHSISFHIEHRIFLTRWLNVGLFFANHERWDLLMQACVNAVLAGLCVLVLIRGFGAHFVDFWYWLFGGLTTACFALPTAYENMLWGFQSQHFFFLLFSVLSIPLVIRSRPLCATWWLGIGSAACSCLSLGSGFYASLTLVAISLLMMLRGRYRSASTWITLSAALLIVILYVPTLGTVHSPEEYKAASIKQFIDALVGNLAWPNIQSGSRWLAVLMWVPWTALFAASLFRRRTLPRSSYSIIALGIWILGVTITLAYLRGRNSPYVRYFDYNSINVVVNAAALGELVRLRVYPRIGVGSKSSLVGAWVTAVIIGLVYLSHNALTDGLWSRRAELLTERRAINRFFRTDDSDVLKGPELNGIFPFREPYSPLLANQLRDPEVQEFLPEEMKTGGRHQRPMGLLSLLSRFVLRQAPRIWLGSIALIALLAAWQIFGAVELKRFLSVTEWRRLAP
jgi:hypothetical protein